LSEDEAELDENPISALAPLVNPLEDMHTEVSGSPAFQCLEDLFESGKISGSRMVDLKSKYKTLHSSLTLMRDSEATLLDNAKHFTSVLEIQTERLDEADDFPENIDSDVGRIRLEYLRKMNELGEIEDRESNLHYQTESLEEELRLIQLDLSRVPNAEKIEGEKREIMDEIEQIKKETAQKHMELKNLRDELDLKTRQGEALVKDLEAKEELFSDLKTDLVCVHSVPTQIQKEVDKIMRQTVEVEDENRHKDATIKNVNDEFKTLNAKHRKLDEEKNEVAKEVEAHRGQLKGREYEHNNLQRDYDFEKEREAVLLSDRATLDLALRHVNMEKKSSHDQMTRQQRENDRDIRMLKKTLAQEKSAQESYAHLENIYDRVVEQSEQYPKESPYLKKRKQLQVEVDEAKRRHAQQQVLTSVELVKVEDVIMVEERLMKQQEDLRATVVDFYRLAQIKADEREQKSRDFVRAEQRFFKSQQELKSKQLSLLDHNKKHVEVKLHLEEFAKLYNTIKNERNKCVNQIQSCTQKSVEMREKVRILANEIEILRNSVQTHDKDLQRGRLRMMNSLVARDTLRNEQCKSTEHERQLIEEREQLKMEISRLNTLNNQAEESMVQLRKRYEDSVQHRNDRGVQLVEREEEVCIFYEKLNVQDTMLRKGDLKVCEMDNEVKFLKLQQSEDRRTLDLTRKNVPHCRNLNNELVTLQIQLSQCQDRRRTLEKKTEDSSNTARVRMLGGKDPTPAEMQDIIEHLETELAGKEEKLLECELVFEQSARLTDRLDKKVDSGKGDSLMLAKKVNDYQAKTKNVTRKMMSLVSELSMKQAEAMKLQQTVRTMEGEVTQSYTKLEQGEAPSEEARLEWERQVRKETQAKYHKEMVQDEQPFELANGVTTTAEPRPNAYIPNEESGLPVPKPYGALAPFKPSETGSSMRHIRKPILKPIEI